MSNPKKPKIYISGKITGIEDEAPMIFKKAEIKLKEQGFDVVNPMNLKHDHDKSWEAYMREDLTAMLTCDYIYMLKNYADSKGAKVELNLAVELGFTIIFE